MEARDKAKLIAQSALKNKGEDIVIMDMHSASTMYDWFVLISANSSRRINAISRFIQEELAKKDIFPLNIEGRYSTSWVLLDYNDVIAHIFYGPTREFYGLERIWSDIKIERFDAKCLKKTSRKK